MRRLISFHRWLGLLTAVLVLLPAVTAIVLNHRGWLEPPPAASQEPFDQYVLCTAVDRQGAVWLGTSDGLFRSSDGGRTFAPLTLPVAARQVNSLAFDARGTIFVGLRYSGVMRSEDGGKTWTALSIPPEDGEVSAVAMGPDGTLVVTTRAGILRFEGDRTVLHPRPPAPPSTGNGLLRLVYDLHDGRFWGTWGVLVTDLASLAIILLALTGLVMFVKIRRPGRPTR